MKYLFILFLIISPQINAQNLEPVTNRNSQIVTDSMIFELQQTLDLGLRPDTVAASNKDSRDELAEEFLTRLKAKIPNTPGQRVVFPKEDTGFDNFKQGLKETTNKGTIFLLIISVMILIKSFRIESS